MSNDLYAQKIRLVSGSMEHTISSVSVVDPRGIVTEPSGSIIRSQDGRLWINIDGGTSWVLAGPNRDGLLVSGSITGTLDLSVGRNLTVTGDLRVSGSITGSGGALLGQTTIRGAGLDTVLGATTTHIRAGVAAGVIWLGDSNTGGIALGNSSNPTNAFGTLYTADIRASGSLTGSGDAWFQGDLVVSGTLTAASIPAVDSAYTSLQAGVTASVGAAYTSLQAGVTSSVVGAYTSLQAGVTASVGSLIADGAGAVGKLTMWADANTLMDSDFSQSGAIANIALNLLKVGETVDGAVYIRGSVSSDSSINFEYGTNGAATGYLNRWGYLGQNTQYRNLSIRNGRNQEIVLFTGNSLLTTFRGPVNHQGNVNIGGEATDAHGLAGTLTANGTVGTNGKVLQVLDGLPKWGDPADAGIVMGTGSENVLPKWAADGSTLVDSAISDDDVVGINKSTGITGDLRVSGSITGSGDARLNGDVGIKMDATASLDVSGTARFQTPKGTDAVVFGSDARQWSLHPDSDDTLVLRQYANVWGSSGSDLVTFKQNATIFHEAIDVIGNTTAHNLILTGTLNANGTAGSEDQILKIVDGVPTWAPGFGSAALTGTTADLYVQGSITGSGDVHFARNVFLGPSVSKVNPARLTVSGSNNQYAVRIFNETGLSNADMYGIEVNQGGGISTSTGNRTSYGLRSVVQTVRVGVVNSLHNVAGYFSASNGQANTALWTVGNNTFDGYTWVGGNLDVDGGNIWTDGAVTASNYVVLGPSSVTTPARLYLGRQIFTGSAVYTPTPGTKAVNLRMVGGGGAGGGVPGAGTGAGAGAGGSSGVYLEKWIAGDAITGGTVIVGGGGKGVSEDSGNDGGDTKVTINGITYTAKGGAGGSSMSRSTVAGLLRDVPCPSGSSPADIEAGDAGRGGIRLSSTVFSAGSGGSGPLGVGGCQNGVGDGVAGRGYGAGGSGAAFTGAAAGGAGARGVVIIDEYG